MINFFKKKNIVEDKPLISTDNKIISPEVKKEPLEVHKGFIKDLPIQAPNKENKGILMHNGRPYKQINEYQGMYTDNGQLFKLK